MKMDRFKATLLEGHKDAACEVPFDPEKRWGIPAAALWRGRRGHRVRGRLNGVSFESAVVPRSLRFWLLIDEEIRKRARLEIGGTATVYLGPADGNGAGEARTDSRLPGGRRRKLTARRRIG